MSRSIKNHTFVICAYKESAFLEECILSLLQQSVTSNILIYTSTPNTHIQRLAEKYHLDLCVDDSKGIGANWNGAMACAKTEYVTIAHQDDVYDSNYLVELLPYLNSGNETILFSHYGEIRGEDKVYSTRNLSIKKLLLKGLAVFPKWRWWRNRFLSLGNPICCPAVTYHKEKLDGFQFNEQMRTNLDWYAWYDISQRYNGEFVFIDKPLMLHRIHEESETSKTIEENVRTQEDYDMFLLFWPKWIADILIKQYVKSQASNDVN